MISARSNPLTRCLGIALLVGSPAVSVLARAQQSITIASPLEYNAYMTAQNTQAKDAQAAAFELFLQQYPNSAVKKSVLFELMQDYEAIKNTEKFFDVASRYVSAYPDDPVSSRLIQGTRSTGRSLVPDAVDHFNRGAQFYNAHDDLSAAHEFQAAVNADPAFANAYYYLGMTLLSQTTLEAGKIKPARGTALAFQKYLALASNGAHAGDAKSNLAIIGAPASSPEAQQVAAQFGQHEQQQPRQSETQEQQQQQQARQAAEQQEIEAEREQEQQQKQEAQQQEQDRQQKIEDLQSDIQEQEQEAAQWDQQAEQISNSPDSCQNTGVFASLCHSVNSGIGTAGAAKARQNAAKARQQIEDDREEIARLQNMPVEHHQIDTSYGAALQQQNEITPAPNIQDTTDQEVAQIRAIGAANDATRRRIGAQPPPPSSGINLNRPSPSQPITVVITHSNGWAQGFAHIVSTPPGLIDCPGSCSATLAQGFVGSIEATAGSNSIVHGVGACAWSGGSTGMLSAGNTVGCPIQVRGGDGSPETIYVYADLVGSNPNGPPSGNGLPPSSSTVPTTYSNGSGFTGNGGQGGSSASSEPACTDTTASATVKVTTLTGPGHCSGEAAAYITNHSSQTLWCEVGFFKGGSIDKGGIGGTAVRPGQTFGGEGGGLWECGADVPARAAFYCYPNQQHGACRENVTW